MDKLKSEEFQQDIYHKVWNEASELRKSGKLLELGKQIECPVVVIHGDYDQPTYRGVKEPLSQVVKEFKFILLKKCGHKPWIEREARNKFYKIIKKIKRIISQNRGTSPNMGLTTSELLQE